MTQKLAGSIEPQLEAPSAVSAKMARIERHQSDRRTIRRLDQLCCPLNPLAAPPYPEGHDAREREVGSGPLVQQDVRIMT